MGFLKDRETRASQPIMLRDADTELEQSIRMHSRYVGLAIPVRDFMKIWNVTTWGLDEKGNHVSYENSVKKTIKRKWGKAGAKYVEKLMYDLNVGKRHEDSEWGQLFGKLRSNYAGAVLTLNAGVAFKQAASYPTAAAVLGTKPLMMAMKDFGAVDLDLIAKYTPLQWYRSLGYSTRELGDMARHDKGIPSLLNWVQGADLLTTRKLWKASEYYVRLNQKTLKRGTESYYRAVADIYNRVIEETQPNYTVMQRPQMLRSDDILSQTLGVFKTQPFQNFNILYDSYKNLRAKQSQAKAGIATETDVKTASRDFGRAVYSQLMQLAVFAAMTIGWAKWRDRDEKYRDEEGQLRLIRGWALEMCGGLLSDIPGGSDIWEFASSKLFGQKYYGMEITATQMISDTVTSLDKLAKTISDTAGKLAHGEEVDVRSVIRQADSSADDLTKLFGIPYQNGMNLFLDATRNIQKLFMNPVEVDYELTKWAADSKKAAYDHLFQTGGRKFYPNPEGDGVPKDYRVLYQRMLQDGFEESDIQDKMKGRWIRTPDYLKKKNQYAGLLSGTALASPAYARLDETRREKLAEYIQAAAKYEMFRDYVDGYQATNSEKWIADALALNSDYQIPLPDLIILHAGKSGLTSLTETDRKGNKVAIDNSEGLQIMEMAYSLFPEMEKWDAAKRRAVLEWLGVGKTLLRYNSNTVTAQLERMRRKSSPSS